MPDKLGVGTFVEDQLELVSSGLDIFSIPEIDNSIIYGKTVTYYPIGAISDRGPFEFFVPHDGNDYTFLPMTRLEGEIKITKKDGSEWAAADNIGFANLLPHTLFRQIEVEINKTQICDLSTPTYPYKAYIETLLSFGSEAKNTHLKCELFEKEEIKKEEDFTGKRLKSVCNIAKAKKIYFSMILHVDFFQSNKYLIPGCNLNLKFIRNDDDFSLLSATSIAKIKIEDLRLTMRKLTIDPDRVIEQEKILEKMPAIYPITQSKIRPFPIMKGTTSERISNIFRNKLPRSLIFGLVSDAGFNNDVTKNPFLFKDFGMCYFNIFINGEPVLTRAFQPNFDADNPTSYLQSYRWFMDNIGIAHENETNAIELEDFIHNSFFIPFDLSPDMCNNFHPHGPIQGTLDLQISFTNALTNNLQLICYGSFNETISIDKDRNVTIIQ